MTIWSFVGEGETGVDGSSSGDAGGTTTLLLLPVKTAVTGVAAVTVPRLTQVDRSGLTT